MVLIGHLHAGIFNHPSLGIGPSERQKRAHLLNDVFLLPLQNPLKTPNFKIYFTSAFFR